RHTRLQGDWSSDVCSSDLGCVVGREEGPIERRHAPEPWIVTLAGVPEMDVGVDYLHRVHAALLARTRSSATANTMMLPMMISWRSEERRVGKECRSQWWGE